MKVTSAPPATRTAGIVTPKNCRIKEPISTLVWHFGDSKINQGYQRLGVVSNVLIRGPTVEYGQFA